MTLGMGGFVPRFRGRMQGRFEKEPAEALEAFGGEPKQLGDFSRLRPPAFPSFDVALRAFEVPSLLADRPRHPVHGAQLVEHSASNPDLRVGGEAAAKLR